MEKYIMKCILLENKVVLEKNAQVNESQIADLMNEKKSFERLKISTKNRIFGISQPFSFFRQ